MDLETFQPRRQQVHRRTASHTRHSAAAASSRTCDRTASGVRQINRPRTKYFLGARTWTRLEALPRRRTASSRTQIHRKMSLKWTTNLRHSIRGLSPFASRRSSGIPDPGTNPIKNFLPFWCEELSHLPDQISTLYKSAQLFLMGHPRAIFDYFRSFSNKHQYNFYNKLMWKMSIQYTVLEFEPTTFRTWVSSHNH